MNEPPSRKQAARTHSRPRGRRHEPRPEPWEQIWLGDGEGQAAIVAGALEAKGIRTHVNGYQPMPQAYPTAWARSNWAIHVPASQAAAARDHLRDSGENANLIEAGAGFRREQVFVLKLAGAGLLALVIVSSIGVLFSGWSL
ncbi:MAG: hypothetical protein WD557_04660 [Dehalococcoidia bacterium]